MDGILIQYEYGGDESRWQAVMETFILAVETDPDLKGKFTYSVCKTSEPMKRVHVGRWDSNQTLETLKQKSFFKTFTESMEKLAGDSLVSTRLFGVRETAQ